MLYIEAEIGGVKLIDLTTGQLKDIQAAITFILYDRKKTELDEVNKKEK